MPATGVTISPRAIERIRSGHPWIYRSDILDATAAEPGAIVHLLDRRKHFWGQALYSSQSQIALRLLTRDQRPFDHDFLAERIRAAADFRERVVGRTGLPAGQRRRRPAAVAHRRPLRRLSGPPDPQPGNGTPEAGHPRNRSGTFQTALGDRAE